jgi:hypothetical protein
MQFAAVALAALALGTGPNAESNVAPCDKAIAGNGSAGWRSESLVAGPVGVRRQPLRGMSRTGDGLVTKMPILIEGRAPATVTVSVPPALRKRVFLLYGNVLDRDGNPSTSFRNTRGYSETEFELCGNKPRTLWPGAIRVKGEKPVRLLVSAEGAAPVPLRLGRPRAYELSP